MSLTDDPSAALDGLVRLEPYQREPILSQFAPGVREVVVMAPEQTGKSCVWRWGLVYRMVHQPGPMWVVYESDDKAEDINNETLLPMLQRLPEVADQLTRKTATKRRYSLANGTVLDFSGAGADITSKPRQFGVADELDTWPLGAEDIRRNLENFRKRFRTFWAAGSGCLVIVSSPKGATSIVGEEWESGSQGIWHLRCDGCGGLTMASRDIRHLQFDRTEAGAVVPESLRLVCPACGHRHEESRAQALNDAGGYEHRQDNPRKRTYQWGALACPRVFSWADIADAQILAGKSSSPRVQQNFDNSWRGIPFRPRKADGATLDLLRSHCAPLPDPAILAGCFFAADTQDQGWWWVVRGVDAAGNSYRLGCGYARSEPELAAAWDDRYLGLRPALGLIDHGGHGQKPDQVLRFCAAHRGIYAYKGDPRIGTRWKPAKETPLLFLANSNQYKADLLYYLYTQTRRGENYWYLPPDPGEEYLAQLAALRKPETGANTYERWDPGQRDDHYFDAEKMWLVALDMARAQLPREAWRIAPGPTAVEIARATAKPARPRRVPTVEYDP